jgi:hypothetical protein
MFLIKVGRGRQVLENRTHIQILDSYYMSVIKFLNFSEPVSAIKNGSNVIAVKMK